MSFEDCIPSRNYWGIFRVLDIDLLGMLITEDRWITGAFVGFKQQLIKITSDRVLKALAWSCARRLGTGNVISRK